MLIINWEDNLEDPRGLLVHSSHFTDKKIQAQRGKMTNLRLRDLVELFIAYPAAISFLFLPSRTSIIFYIGQSQFQGKCYLLFFCQSKNESWLVWANHNNSTFSVSNWFDEYVIMCYNSNHWNIKGSLSMGAFGKVLSHHKEQWY